MMAASVLAEAGFCSVNFGPDTPVQLLADEAIEHRARLVWLSITTPPESTALRGMIGELARKLSRHQIDLVLGGQHHGNCAPTGARNVTIGQSMEELSRFAREIMGRATPA